MSSFTMKIVDLPVQSDATFDMDVRYVLQHQKDKSYGSIGEAFESLFYTNYAIFRDEVVCTVALDHDQLAMVHGGEE